MIEKRTIKNDNSNISNYRNAESVTVSFGKSVLSNELQITNLKLVIEAIKSNSSIKQKIELIRMIGDKDARQEKKKGLLMYFNLGEFTANIRKNENFLRSEFMLFDFDHLEQESLKELTEKIKNNNNVYCSFLSPSGDGLKVIIRLSQPITSSDKFSEEYKNYAKHLSETYGVNADNTSDASRPCYMSHDPDIYLNENAEPVSTGMVDFASVAVKNSNQKKKDEDEENIPDLLQGVGTGSRNDALTRITGLLIKQEVGLDVAIGLLQAWNRLNTPPLPETELIKTAKNLYTRYYNETREKVLRDLWSYGTDIFQLGILGEKFFIEKIGKSKAGTLALAKDGKDFQAIMESLIRNKHIKHLNRIDYLGDIEADQSFYSVSLEEGVIEVHYSAIKKKVEDNQMIEDYLGETFGDYKSFIKQYMAVYCYTNYRKLPTLVFYGPRGTGKTTFAEIMMEIFRPISREWRGEEQNFTPEVEQKFLIIEENNSDKATQYKTLKKYTGQKNAMVNKKFKEPYEVKNNVNVVMLSNEPIPMYVKKEELPVSEANNQFFVFEFKLLNREIDASFQEKILERLGHYIRTELKEVFKSLELDKYRYSIAVPITKEEKGLFNSNTTDIDSESDFFINLLIKRMTEGTPLLNTFPYKGFVNGGYLPASFIGINGSAVTKSHHNAIIKNLKKRGYLEQSEAERIQIEGLREYCYKMTEKFRNEVKEGKFEIIE